MRCEQSIRTSVLRRALTTTAMTAGALFAATAASAQELPVGGTVASGSATIGAGGPGAATTTVTQSSNRAIINWQSFDVAAGKSVVFVQPDASSATLNRVTGGTSSTIAGQIVATGSVYLINPNGIAITASGNVQTGGGFVASTLDIADGDFNSGTLNFTGRGASRRVSNKGRITAGDGGYVALLGGTVLNSGTITVAFGKVGLGSGETIALDLNGDGFMRVAVPTAALTSGNTALIEQVGSIAASGGRVELKAATVKDAVRNVINLSGNITADSATGNGGTIILLGGDGGTVKATGTLSAKATGATGTGGFVETSGATVDFAGLTVDTRSAGGAAGTWLIDPVDLTIDAAAAATISTNLGTGNVTVQTTATTATTPGVQSGTNGDIFINSAISWTSANTLSLLAYRNIALNAAITGTNGGLTLTAGNNVANSGAITATGAVNVGVFNLTNGAWSQNTASLPAFSATDFRFNPANASFLRVTGGTGASATPYTIADVYGFQGLASYNLLGGNYLLVNNIDASGTVNWNAGAGWMPIGTTPGDYRPFFGSFNGGNFTLSNLTINRPSTDYVGLFGIVNNASSSLSNFGLIGGTIRGRNDVGSLGGNLTKVNVSNVFATTNVIGSGVAIGGLYGEHDTGTVTNVYATGSVASGTGGNVGGLTGYESGTLSNAYASGAVSSAGIFTGGLVGYSSGTLSNVYATGSVTSTQQYTGGLVGFQQGDGGPITSAYATGRVTGTTSVGGLVGQSGTITNSYWDSYSTGQAQASGSVTSVAGATVVTSDPAQSAAANYAYTSSAYANLTAGSGIGTATPTGFVFMPGNSTRPFLAFEVPNANLLASSGGSLIIRNSHQLQLIGYNGTTLAASYLIGNAIDLSETGRVTVGTPGSYSGMWAGTGWTPLGSDGAGNRYDGTGFTTTGSNIGFSGSLNGGGFALNGLTIKRSTISSVGLIGTGSGGQTISNIGLTNVAITGFNYTGALMGIGFNSTISNAYSTGTVTGTGSSVGGLLGYVPVGSITGSYSTANVTGTASVGGLIGSDYVATTNSYATGNVMGTGTLTSGQYIGGLAGDTSNAAFTNVYATGNVQGLSNYIGGLIGWQNGGSITGSHASIGTVTGTNGGTYVGGLVGLNAGTISNSYASGDVTATQSNYVGGLTGMATGAVSGSTASGRVIGYGLVGGLVGQSTAAISSSMAYGNVSGTVNYVGGLIGESFGAISGSTASGTVSGQGYVGGLVGHVRGTSVTSSSATGNVTGTSTVVGGLVGLLENTVSGRITSVSNSFATGTVSGVTQVGGLFGYQVSSGGGTASVSGSYATGAVTATSTVNSYAGGLVGQIATTGTTANTRATIDTSYATGSVTAASTNPASYVGGLVGAATNFLGVSSITVGITNSYATGAVQSAGGGLVGGLVGYTTNFTTLSGVYARGTVSGTMRVGGLVGQVDINGVVTNAYATGNVSATSTNVGGLIGQFNSASLSYAYATGAVSTTSTSTTTNAGGLVGVSTGAPSRIGNAYATGAVSSNGGYVGGLIGNLSTSGNAVTNVYATGSVSGNANLGGLVGVTAAGTTITGAYASGAVAVQTNAGALIGNHSGAITNAYWDTYSSGLGPSYIGGGSGAVGVSSVTSDPSQAGTATYAFSPTAYGGLPSVTNPGSATVSGFVTLKGGTRPFLGFEVPLAGNPGVTSSGGVQTLTSAHQLQLIGYSAATLAGSYALGGNIDLSETARVAGAPGSYASVWGAGGFVPLGSDGAGGIWNGSSYVLLSTIPAGTVHGFSGSLDGGGYTVSNLTINRGTIKNVGLFGVTQGAISNVTVGGTVTGLNGVGGLVGLLYTGGTVTGASSTAAVSGNNLIGGLVGNATDGSTITRSSASGTIAGVSDVGGLVGYASGATISRSFATAAVTGVNYAGGLVGYLYNSAVSNSYATGNTTATGATAGGLIGYLYGGSVLNSYAANQVTSPGIRGGLIGQLTNGGTVTSSYWDTTLGGLATSAGGTGRTTAQMQDSANYATNFAGWEFTAIWLPPTSGAYPTLRN